MTHDDRTLPSPLLRIYPLLGLAGAVLACAVMLAAALLYSGKRGERYSPLNHFVSELGEAGVSRAAGLFNVGLVAAGILFVPYCVGLGLHLATPLSYAGMAAGICTGAFLAGVGIFPMTRLAPHIFTATWFFRSGLVTVVLFGVAFAAQRRGCIRVRRAAAVPISALAALAYAAFLVMMSPPTTGTASSLDTSLVSDRPAFWPMAAMEWVVILATILWFLGISFTVRRASSVRTPQGEAERGGAEAGPGRPGASGRRAAAD